MWCWRRMEKIIWTDHVRNEEVLLRVKGQRNILHEKRKRKANCIGHILRRNCLLQRLIEGKIKWGIEVTGSRERKRRKLLDDLKERRGYSHLKEEALYRTMWRARFGRGFGPVVRQTTKWMKEAVFQDLTKDSYQPPKESDDGACGSCESLDATNEPHGVLFRKTHCRKKNKSHDLNSSF